MHGERLTIEVTGRTEFIPVASFLNVVTGTLAILKELDDEMRRGRKPIRWRISEVHLHSPLSLTIDSDSAEDVGGSRDILRGYMEGFRKIDESAEDIPSYFTETSLEAAKKLVSVLDDEIAKVSFFVPGDKPVTPTQHVAANVDRLISRRELMGSFEGTIEMISIHGGLTFNIYHVLTGDRIACSFPEKMLEDVKSSLGERVIVFGKACYRGRKPVSVKVEQIKHMRPSDELPQFKDLEGVDITGGMDPTEYVRRLRDAD